MLSRLAPPAAVSLGTAVLVDLAREWMDRHVSRNVTAVVDTALHGLLAAVLWGGVILLSREEKPPSLAAWAAAVRSLLLGDLQPLLQDLRRPAGVTAVLLCAGASSVLDLDHFLAAGSFTMHGAMHLPARPFGHSVTFAITTLACVHALARAWLGVLHLGPLLAVAWGSHQARDACRRGLWFWPLGSTPPLPYAAYLLLIACAPYAAVGWLRLLRAVVPADAAPGAWMQESGAFDAAWGAGGGGGAPRVADGQGRPLAP